MDSLLPGLSFPDERTILINFANSMERDADEPIVIIVCLKHKLVTALKIRFFIGDANQLLLCVIEISDLKLPL